MKKILAMLLALSLIFAFAACEDEKSVEVNSLKPADALKKYVSSVYTENGFSMEATINYDGAEEVVNYSVIAPFDSARLQYVYNDIACISEIDNGAKLTYFYHTDAEGKKVAQKLAANSQPKEYVLSSLIFSDGEIFTEEGLNMEFESAGNMTFTGTNLSSGIISAYKSVYPMPEDADSKAYTDEVKALEYVYAVEDGNLTVTIEGTVNGKPLSIVATNFQVLEKGAQLTVADAASYEKID